MLSREEIIAKLKDIMRGMGNLPEEKIAACQEETDLVTELGLSSIDFLYMVIFLEQTFDVQFDNVEINDFKTLRQTVDFIQKQLSEK